MKQSNPSQWYSKLKRICSYDQEKPEQIVCEEINTFTDAEQAEKISDLFALPRNNYDALDKNDIEIPPFPENSIPQFTQESVFNVLKGLKVKKSVPPGDIPTIIFKTFASELSTPVTIVINSSIRQGVWPDIYKTEYITPVPKLKKI